MTHTHHAGLLATWTQSLDRKRHVRIFIWENSQRLFDCLKQFDPDRELCDGCCRPIWAYHRKTGRRLSGRKFAELHLDLTAMSVGLVAHEVQHLVGDWIRFKSLDVEIDTKKIAKFAEDVTTKYWVEFYKRFELLADKPAKEMVK